jgi:hypothetical protein
MDLMQDPEGRSIGRGPDNTGGHGPSQKVERLAVMFADTVTGPYNQDVSFLLVGKKGTGKSMCTLSIGYYTAIEIAERIGGTWQDYFDIDTNMACVDPYRASEVMGILDKYTVKIYDDIGIGWGARNWQSEENKARNDIFQINRIDNQVQLFTVPNQFLLDKVPRSLVSHYAETSRAYFKRGFITIKLFIPQTLFRVGKIIQPLIEVNRNKFVEYAVPLPPHDLVERYHTIRLEVTRQIAQERKEQMMKEQKGEGALSLTGVKLTARDRMWREREEKYSPVLSKMSVEGNTETEMARATGLSRDAVRTLKGRLNLL